MMMERYRLASERIAQICGEEIVKEPYQEYFKKAADLCLQLVKEFEWIESGGLKNAALSELQERNHLLYAELIDEAYDSSYANPTYCMKSMGDPFAGILSLLYTELRSMIPAVYEQDREELVIRMELFLEIYVSFTDSFAESGKEPSYETLQQILYWFVSDYSEIAAEKKLREQLDPDVNFAAQIICGEDLLDIRYLYYFGEYVTDQEIRMAKYINSLPQETVEKAADTFTQGYKKGFEAGGKDITKKRVVNIWFHLGFERIVKKSIENFEKMNLRPSIYRSSLSIFHRKQYRSGYYGAIPNKQFEYDHKEDEAICFDKMMVNRKLEVLKEAYEALKELAAVHGGPACMETFGADPFAPDSKEEVIKLSPKQQKLMVEYKNAASRIVNDYIKGEERSFTIISFPTPEIGSRFEEIFTEILKVNTLDSNQYQIIQQNIIDALDLGTHVMIKGCRGNKTDLVVALKELKDSSRETNFENCLADVNIPVGEVFTSPKLKGTNGILHVSKSYLHEMKFCDLMLQFKDGFVTEYSCANFDTDEENSQYIKEQILFHHDTLPLGEFAIGTNTTAYVTAAKYGIEDKLPVLIAEKMGPHFAVGDTCYSHSEDVVIRNPDGKEVIARDNEVSILRKTDPLKAYFSCHTDITIPYDELGELSVMTKNGDKLPVILEGRFVLPGCEELNKPFE